MGINTMRQARIVNPSLFVLSVIAIFLRIAYVNFTVIDTPIRADAQQYVFYGYNLSHFGVYSKSLPGQKLQPDSYRSPGYPLVIALSFLIGKEQFFYPIMLTTQAVLGAAMVPLTYGLGCMLLPVWAAFAAACLVAFSPHLVSITSYLLTETLFGFVLLAGITCFYKALKQRRPLLYASAGSLLGYAYLTNESSLFVPFLFAGAVLIYFRSRPDQLLKKSLYRGVGIFLLVFILFPIGWFLRNAIVLAPDAPRGGDRAVATMSHGAYPGFIFENPRYQYFPYREDPMQPAFGGSIDDFLRIFWSRFKERPVRYLSWYLLEKPYYIWSWNILQGQGDIYIYPVLTSLYIESEITNWTRVAMKYIHPVILLLAFAGGLLFVYRYRQLKGDEDLHVTPLLLFLVCLYYTMFYTIFASWPRYSIPLRPELYLIALWTLEQGRKAYTNRWGDMWSRQR